MCQQLQGAKRCLRQRLEPHPVGSRVRRQGQPQTRSKGRGGEHVTTCDGRTLERAKDNRRLSASARTTRKSTCRAGREEKPQTEFRSPTIRRKGAAPTTSGGRAKPTPDPYGDFILKGSDKKKKQPKGKGKTH